MADDTMKFLLGLAVGAVVVGVILYVRENGSQQQPQTAALTTHNVVRDEEGRIQSVDTLSGLPMGHQAQQAPAQPPAPVQPQVPRIGDER